MFRKWSTSFCVYNILIATHLQPEYTTNTHETRGEHTIRRRKPIHRARILALSNIHFRFNKYAFSHYQICVSLPHFSVVYVSANTIKLCANVHLQLAITQQHTQNAYFRNAKTILLQCKNHTFEKQKPHYSKVIAKRNINNSQYLEK